MYIVVFYQVYESSTPFVLPLTIAQTTGIVIEEGRMVVSALKNAEQAGFIKNEALTAILDKIDKHKSE